MREISHTKQKCEAIKQKISERVAILGVTGSIFNCISRWRFQVNLHTMKHIIKMEFPKIMKCLLPA